MAEALALRGGLHLANTFCCESISIESDNLEIVEVVRNGQTIGEIAVVLEDILCLKIKFKDCRVFSFSPTSELSIARSLLSPTV